MLQGAFIKGGGPGAFGRMSQGGADPRGKEELQTVQGGPSTWSNPAGRVSVQFAPGAVSIPPKQSPSQGLSQGKLSLNVYRSSANPLRYRLAKVSISRLAEDRYFGKSLLPGLLTTFL